MSNFAQFVEFAKAHFRITTLVLDSVEPIAEASHEEAEVVATVTCEKVKSIMAEIGHDEVDVNSDNMLELGLAGLLSIVGEFAKNTCDDPPEFPTADTHKAIVKALAHFFPMETLMQAVSYVSENGMSDRVQIIKLPVDGDTKGLAAEIEGMVQDREMEARGREYRKRNDK